jgi:Superinfection immunity protein
MRNILLATLISTNPQNKDAGSFVVISVWFVLLLLAACFYFLPGGVALLRRHHNAGAIVALNLFLGWTLVGWVACLVWALTNQPIPPQTR